MGYSGLYDQFYKDEIESIKVGSPYVGVLGSTSKAKQVGICTRCFGPLCLDEAHTMLFCPHCRKQFGGSETTLNLVPMVDPSGQEKAQSFGEDPLQAIDTPYQQTPTEYPSPYTKPYQ